jgi:DNA polymerase III epsilon subunit-like protein
LSAEVWVSVDVETSGPTPGIASLLAIGACLVDRPEEAIELLLRPDAALAWSDEAEAVHRLSRERLAREGLEPGHAMERFAGWLERVTPAGSRPVFVSLNAPFDWMFVADYLWRHLGRNPFGISALDLKALYLGRHLDEIGEWAATSSDAIRAHYPIESPHTHDALDDAREQAEICRRIRDGAPTSLGTAPPAAESRDAPA